MQQFRTCQNSFQIRNADPNDGDAILTAAFREYRPRYTPEAFADTVLHPETVQRHLSEMCLLVAVSEGEVMGTMGYRVSGVWPESSNPFRLVLASRS